MDGELAVIGLGSVGSMALWQAARRSGTGAGEVVGFEARTPGHTRSAVGGDTRLFRMTYRGGPRYAPLLERANLLWPELEAEAGQEILNRCGGLSIGARDGEYLPQLLASATADGTPFEFLDHDELAARYPQHRLRPDDCALFDPRAGFLRTDRAVLAATRAAREAGAEVLEDTAVDEIHEEPDSVVLRSGPRSWRFERVIVAAGGWSSHLLPPPVAAAVHPRRNYLTWFVARRPEEFTPERFPIFIRIESDRSLYGAPSTDGVTVKATLDGRSQPAEHADRLRRELTEEEITETRETVSEFLPGLVPSIVRADAFPDLFTADHAPLLGCLPGRPRTVFATGFSGTGFKIAPASAEAAVAIAFGEPATEAKEFDPARFGAG
ncbi:FAD-dependent oxidoreductase [Amycolatopsis balhimycina DSM 5908]|uniref:FAD-dependent oxidoreductase n=1 Tax=Amycolatopsis balhimycina DSM 5908 TaxID=1081091 RepID=A0A428WW40_AMYBA|nr:N-methyl-L-tryptophan oxidase [Amycolatopsis balhimycina]RSM47296.1 FAD-dependent oxidoreductase [Amycolatopsis balhimycina DSM 5908]